MVKSEMDTTKEDNLNSTEPLLITTLSSTFSGQSFLNTSSVEQLKWESNERRATTLIPAMVFIGMLIVTGLCGNMIVCYIFIRHIRLSTSTFLLLFLAALDLINCFLAMPFEIVDMRYYHVFYSDVICKIFRFIVAFPNINSMFILLIITIDRYKKVCKPMKRQMKFKDAKLYVMIASLSAILLSFPAVFIYGLRTVPTGIDGVFGTDCSTSDAMKTSILPLIYQTLGGGLMLLICGTLCYLYGCIWREIRRHTSYVRTNTQLVLLAASRRENQPKTNPDPSFQKASCFHGSCALREESSTQDPEKQSDKDPPATYPDLQEDVSLGRTNSKYRFASGYRITVVAFTVTIVFMLSNAPYAVIMVIRAVRSTPICYDEGACFVIYNILLRSFFVSTVINPVIYGFMSKQFRQECLKLGAPCHSQEK